MSKRNRVLMLVLLVVLATYATLYTVAAHDLARWGWTCRGTLGDATFLPFPTGPRGVLMDVLAKMSPVDEFIYTYLIKTRILIGISILLWILAAIYFFKVVLPLFGIWIRHACIHPKSANDLGHACNPVRSSFQP